MPRILVMGELNVDLVMSGLPSLPVLGQELIGTGFHVALGSSSAITAARLSALGAKADFVGQVGDDDLGRFVVRELTGFGVETKLVRVLADSSTDVTIALTYEHDRALLTCSDLMGKFDGNMVTPELLSNYVHLHVGSYFLQTNLQSRLPFIFQMAHEAGLTTSLDTGWDPYNQWMNNAYIGPTLMQTDYFFPNESEARELCGGTWDPSTLVESVRGLLVVKRGAKGALAVTSAPDRDWITVPSFPVKVIDTTGAGDAFNAGFIYATVIKHTGLTDGLRFSVACGAQAVTQVGGATNPPSARVISTQYLKQSTI